MKSLIIGLALMCGAPALAAQDCTPYIVAEGESAGHYVYPCGNDHTVTHRGCIEGEYAYDTVMGASGEYVQVTIQCKNGRFTPVRAPRNSRSTCRNGEYAYDTVMGSSGEYVSVTLICKNGHFVPANP